MTLYSKTYPIHGNGEKRSRKLWWMYNEKYDNNQLFSLIIQRKFKPLGFLDELKESNVI